MSVELIESLPYLRLRQYDNGIDINIRTTGGSVRHPVGAGEVAISASTRFGRPTARVEFNGPRLLNGHNRDALPLSLLPDTVDAVLADLHREFAGLPTYVEVNLIRLDVTRDIDGVTDPALTLGRIARLPPRRPFTMYDEHHRRDGRVQSVVRGVSGRWRSTGYAKGYEMAEKAAQAAASELGELLAEWASVTQDRIRFETHLYSALLRERSMQKLHHFDPAPMHKLVENYFMQTGMATLLSGSDVAQRLLLGLDDSDRRGVLALLAAQLIDVPPGMGKKTLDKHTATARRLGLTPDSLIADDGEPRRLDFASGRELRGDAALVGLL